MQVCTSLQTDNHASTLPLSFLQSGCPSCHPTNSVEALKGCMCFDNFDIYLICVTRPHCFAECKTLPIVTIVAWSVCLLVTRELCKSGWTDRGSIWLLTWVYLSLSSLCNGRGSLNCVLAHPGSPGQRAVKRVWTVENVCWNDRTHTHCCSLGGSSDAASCCRYCGNFLLLFGDRWQVWSSAPGPVPPPIESAWVYALLLLLGDRWQGSAATD